MLNFSVHKNILVKILKDIYTDSSLGPFLGFKGGTAAYIFYGLNRFSIDLNFDLLDKSKKEEVFEKVESIVKKYGAIKRKKDKKNILFLLSCSEDTQNIKIEINERKFSSRYEIKNYLGISMMVIKKEDMFSHKLITMLDRKKTAMRDVYDVYFFLRNDWDLNEDIVKERTSMDLKDYLKKCIDFVEKMSEKNILAEIGELLNEEEKKWVKFKLKEETLFLIKNYMMSLK